MSHTISVELPDDIYAALQHQATAANTSPAQLVVQSLAHQFGRRSRSVQDVLVQAGLATADAAPLTHTAPLSQAQRQALAQQVAHGRPLSDYIRDERDER